MAGLYVHIPFCRNKCIYCDFYSVGERCADWSRFVDALLAEARERISFADSFHENFDTIYIGGGTPSLMPEDQFKRLADGMRKLAPQFNEFTIEVNPDDVTVEKALCWKDAGVNRLSMGVQSLDDRELKMLRRRHDADCALKAYDMLRRMFDNISLDLMFGLPGQTLGSLRKTLEGFAAMRPEHVSAYSLMYEERTALTRLRDAGKMEELPEEDSQEMFQMISGFLSSADYEQYEISNYALPGFRSRHNSNYWIGKPYLGLGPGAHSCDGKNRRIANKPDIRQYLAQCLAQGPAQDLAQDHPQDYVQDFASMRVYETLGEEELREEMIMTRMRTREGLNLDEYSARFGAPALNRLLHSARPWLQTSHLQLTPSHLQLTPPHLSLTPQGIMISDEIFISLF